MDNAMWAIVGFVAGVLGTLWLERRSRFRAALEQAARTVEGLGGEIIRTESAAELQRLIDRTFNDVQFELALQGQRRAREIFGAFRGELVSIVQIANADLLKPEAARFLQQMKGDYLQTTRVRATETLSGKQDDLVERVLAIEPDWIVIVLGRRVGSRMRARYEMVVEYLKGTGELK